MISYAYGHHINAPTGISIDNPAKFERIAISTSQAKPSLEERPDSAKARTSWAECPDCRLQTAGRHTHGRSTRRRRGRRLCGVRCAAYEWHAARLGGSAACDGLLSPDVHKKFPLLVSPPDQHTGRPSADEATRRWSCRAERITSARTVRIDIPQREVRERAAGGLISHHLAGLIVNSSAKLLRNPLVS